MRQTRETILIEGGHIIDPGRFVGVGDLLIDQGKVAAIGHNLAASSGGATIQGSGKLVLPGLVDLHVHFREPGFEYKEDLATGTAAAALGGVTAVFDMPNTKPSTLTAEDLADKRRRAEGRVWCDVAFFVGAATENADRLAELERMPGCAGVKMFMGSSTGNLLVADEENIRRVLENGRRRMAVHSEDEARLRERLSTDSSGALRLRARAWAVKGVVRKP